MSATEYETWVSSIGKKADRYSILFLQLGACHDPARRALAQSGSLHRTIDEYLAQSFERNQQVIVIEALEGLLVNAIDSLGPLRDKVMSDVDAGNRIVLLSRPPRIAFPLVPGSSLLEDARFVHGPNLETGTPEHFPSCSEDGRSVVDVVRSALVELGPEVCASLDRVVYESMLSGSEALSIFSARELEALAGAAFTSIHENTRVWNFSRSLGPLKLALDDVMAADVEPQPQLGQVNGALWSMERSIRKTIRDRAISAWGRNWRAQCLNGDLPGRVLDRAAESAYLAAKSIKELRDPLEWLTLGELLDLRDRKEIGNLGLQPVLWRQFATQILPIRNRLSHMRTLRPQDYDDVVKWLRVVERKLSAAG